jgi:hypothetical protein
MELEEYIKEVFSDYERFNLERIKKSASLSGKDV